jgi:hypothetical protein
MAVKKAAASPQLPARFVEDEVYNVIVKTAFQVARMTIRPGKAMLLGRVAEEHRDCLLAAWIE